VERMQLIAMVFDECHTAFSGTLSLDSLGPSSLQEIRFIESAD
jgi:hypothetical protein